MEDRLKGLKKTLEESVLSEIKITKIEKERLLDSLNTNNKKPIPYKYYFSFVAVAVILFILFIPKLFQEQYQSASIINEEISSELGFDVYFPDFEEYKMSSAGIFYGIANRNTASVEYSKNLGELLEIPESTEQKFLYGPYDSDIFFRITFKSFQVDSNDDYTKKINGYDVYYSIVEGEDKFLLATINTDQEGSYFVEFNLSDEFSEEDAFDILDTFTKGI